MEQTCAPSLFERLSWVKMESRKSYKHSLAGLKVSTNWIKSNIKDGKCCWGFLYIQVSLRCATYIRVWPFELSGIINDCTIKQREIWTIRNYISQDLGPPQTDGQARCTSKRCKALININLFRIGFNSYS